MPNYAGITERDVKTLLGIYNQAYKQIITEIRKSDIVDSGQKQFLLSQIRTIMNDLQNPTNEFLQFHIPKEYVDGVNVVNKALGNRMTTVFGVINQDAVRTLIDDANIQVKTALNTGYQSIESLFSKLTKDMRDKAILETGKAIITGSARRELSQQLLMLLQADGITGYSYINKAGKKVNVKLETYIDSLARTALRDAQTYGTVQQALDNDIDLVKVSRHSNPSELCGKWQGEILSLSGKTPGYPTLEEAKTWKRGYGLFHRWCRHRITPLVQTDIQFK